MNIKKLTLIATAVSALSLSPLTYARTESTDMSIIGIEPECSYFADLRFHASPFGSKGNIAAEKDSKFEFDKTSWGGNLGFGTEITPGVEVAVVASVMTNIGTDSASSTSVSSSSGSTATTTPTAASGIKLEDKHRDAYNRWVSKNPEVLDFLKSQFSMGANGKALHQLLAAKDYNMRSAKILAPEYGRFGGGDNQKPLIDIAKDSASALQQNYGGRLYTNAGNQDYKQRLSALIAKARDTFGNDDSFNKIKRSIYLAGMDDAANGAALDAVRGAITSKIGVAAGAGANANANITNDDISRLRDMQYADISAANAADSNTTWYRVLTAMPAIFDTFFRNADPGISEIEVYSQGAYLGRLYRNSQPSGAVDAAGPNAAADYTAANMYNIHGIGAAAQIDEESVRQLFYHEKFGGNLIVFGDIITAAAEQDVNQTLDQMVANILSNHKGSVQYKQLLATFSDYLKQAGITDRTAEEIIDAITAQKNAQAQAAAANNPATGTGTASTTASTIKKPIDVNLTKFRIGIEGGVKLLEFDAGSLSVVAGVGAAAVTGTVAGEDTGYMWGAEIYGGVKGEYAISESMAITARYTYTPSLFSGLKLSNNVQTKVKSLGYADDATMSPLSMHELSAGIRFYF